jgi:hypothetical protein
MIDFLFLPFPQTVEQLAMATLTQEFITKFQPEKK